MKYESQIFLILLIWGVTSSEVDWRDTGKNPKVAEKQIMDMMRKFSVENQEVQEKGEKL